MNAMWLSPSDYAALCPLLILVGSALLLLVIESFFEKISKEISPLLAFLGFAAALICLLNQNVSTNPLLTRWLQFDAASQYFSLLFLATGMGTTVLSFPFLKRGVHSAGEYSFLLTAAVFGLILVGMSADLLTLFIGIETLSLSLYVLCGYLKKDRFAQESAIKYFLMGALSSAFLLFGIALLYGSAGSTQLDALLAASENLPNQSEAILFYGGLGLVLLGLSFKAAVFPFHNWAPDVYAGAPTPVTAFMAVGTKAGAFAALTRVVIEALPQLNAPWHNLLAFLAVPTLIYANWVALKQTHLRRFFAYSGISHAGFLLVGVAAGTSEAFQAVLFYLVLYTLATLAAFAVIATLETDEKGLSLENLKGLFRHSPFMAGILALSLFTLAGIPPTAGFFAKFFIFKVAFEQGYIFPILVGLAAALFGAFYYTRIVALMFMEPATEELPEKKLMPAMVIGLFCFILLLVFSIYPEPVFSFLKSY